MRDQVCIPDTVCGTAHVEVGRTLHPNARDDAKQVLLDLLMVRANRLSQSIEIRQDGVLRCKLD